MKPKEDRRLEVAAKLNVLTENPKQNIRVEAIKALGAWGSNEEVPTLVRLLDHDDGATRRAADISIRRFRDERAVPVLVRRLSDSNCTGEVVAALIAIGPTVEESVLPYLSSNDTSAQAPAIDVLKSIGTENNVSALQKIAPGKFYPAEKAKEALKAIAARSKKK